jgi:hypothetical protein
MLRMVTLTGSSLSQRGSQIHSCSREEAKRRESHAKKTTRKSQSSMGAWSTAMEGR